MERLTGTVKKLDPEEGFGYLRVRGRKEHQFLLSKAPPDIRVLDAVWFSSYPQNAGTALHERRESGDHSEPREGGLTEYDEVPHESMYGPLPAHFVQQRMRLPKALSPMEIAAFRPRLTDKELRKLMPLKYKLLAFTRGVRLAFTGEHESLTATILVHGFIIFCVLKFLQWAVFLAAFWNGGSK